MTELEQEELLEKLEVFKIKGRDKHGRKILRIIGKFFPGKKIFQFFSSVFYVIFCYLLLISILLIFRFSAIG